MANTMEFDFTGVPMATGRKGGDRIAPGTYLFAVSGVSNAPSKGGRPMVTITMTVANEGLALGKKLVEYFTIPRAGTDDKGFGLERFKRLLFACGMKEPKGKMDLDLDKLLEREFVAEVDDELSPAKDGFPERIASRPLMFYRKTEPEADRVGQTSAPLAAPATAPAAAPAPAAAAEAPVAAEAPAAEEASEDEDLFAGLED